MRLWQADSDGRQLGDALADARGRFSFSGLRPGRYVLELGAGNEEGLTVLLEPDAR